MMSRRGRIALAAAVLAVSPVGATAAHADGTSHGSADTSVSDISATVTDITASVEAAETETAHGDHRQIVITSDVLFDVDSAKLTPTAVDHFAQTAERLAQSTGTIAIDGYTDSSGPESYNQDLSERRAEAVARELRKHLGDVDFSVHGHGEDNPIEPNVHAGREDPAAMAKNRRVVIEFRSHR